MITPESKSFGPADFQAELNVSRETLARLKAFVALLEDWSARHNLVSRKSLDDVWRRHVLDSAQLARFIPDQARSLADLGSGAGFPGLVLAILMGDRPHFRAVLFEATGKKCAFLEAAARRVEAKVEIRNVRIEDIPAEMFDVVTARALAPLDKLLAYAHRLQGPDTLNLFLKGQSVADELKIATRYWKMNAVQHPSRSDSSGTILAIRELRHA